MTTLAELRVSNDRRERELIEYALHQNRGLWVQTAAALGVPVSTLQDLLERHGLTELRKQLRKTVTPDTHEVTKKRNAVHTQGPTRGSKASKKPIKSRAA